jgi:hypothetical protein
MLRWLMTWDLKPDAEAGLMKFMTEEFVSSLLKAGFVVTDFWSTAAGHGPQFIFGVAAEDLEAVQQQRASATWLALHAKLMQHVLHFTQKVVPLKHRYQL